MKQTTETALQGDSYIKRDLPSFAKYRLGIFLAVVAVLFLLYGTILFCLFKLWSSAKPSGAYYVQSAPGAWYFVGMLLSLGTAGIVMTYLHKLYLRARFKLNPYLTD